MSQPTFDFGMDEIIKSFEMSSSGDELIRSIPEQMSPSGDELIRSLPEPLDMYNNDNNIPTDTEMPHLINERFERTTEEARNKLLDESECLSTKKSTKYGIKIFKSN